MAEICFVVHSMTVMGKLQMFKLFLTITETSHFYTKSGSVIKFSFFDKLDDVESGYKRLLQRLKWRFEADHRLNW